MRNTISKWMAALAIVTASAAPAMACGGLFTSGGCSPCSQTYASPCGQGYSRGYGYHQGTLGVAGYERLPDPTPVTRQYYYANQGPTFSGPGMFAPAPTYQETAIGWRGYRHYDGGPYADPIDHYSYGRPGYAAPLVTSYHSRSYDRGYSSYRTGYARRSYASGGYHHMRPYAPRVMYAPRHGYPHAHHSH